VGRLGRGDGLDSNQTEVGQEKESPTHHLLSELQDRTRLSRKAIAGIIKSVEKPTTSSGIVDLEKRLGFS